MNKQNICCNIAMEAITMMQKILICGLLLIGMLLAIMNNRHKFDSKVRNKRVGKGAVWLDVIATEV